MGGRPGSFEWSNPSVSGEQMGINFGLCGEASSTAPGVGVFSAILEAGFEVFFSLSTGPAPDDGCVRRVTLTRLYRDHALCTASA